MRKKGFKTRFGELTYIKAEPNEPVKMESGQVIINKKSTKKNIDKLIDINNDSSVKSSEKVTSDGTKGGLLKGKPHYDKNGNSLGGIKVIVDDSRQIEVEGEEFVVNKEASKKHWKELSKINQSAGGGVPIEPPMDEDPEEYKEGGNIIQFNPNHIPNKGILSYAKKIKDKYPEIWDLGGNIFGNEAFINLKRVSERGYWLDSEKWMYIKWRSYVARHKQDFKIAGVIAMLKWVDKVDKGWAYMKELIQERIDKIEANQKNVKNGGEVMRKGGTVTYKEKYNKKYGYDLDKSHDLEEISKDIGISIKGLQQIYNKGVGAYKTNPKSVRSNVKSKEQWAMGRVYSAVMGGKASKVDSNELKMENGGNVEDLISRGIVDLKMYDTTPEHAKEYGLQSINPLYVQTICVNKSKRLKGLGKKVLAYIEKYAIENGHDVVFGHINQKAKFTKDEREAFFCDIDMIKNWLHSNGYAINKDNNDFHKIVDGKVKTKSFVVFFKSNLLNDIIYTNIESDSLSLDEAIEVQKQNYSWSGIKWIKGFETDKGNQKIEFFLQNIKPKWETKPDLSVEMKDGQIVFSKGKDSVDFDVMTLFKNVSGKGEHLTKFNEAYMTHGNTEIIVDSDFNFDRNKIFELMHDKMKNGGNIEYQSRDLNGTMVYYKRKGGSKWEFVSKDEFEKNANEMNIVKFKDGGEIDNSDYFIPANGTLMTKDKKTKLDYKKAGNDYEFSVFDGEPNPVENYSRVQYKKRSNNKVLMNYNQFVDYLYNEGYIDDKFKNGGETMTNTEKLIQEITKNSNVEYGVVSTTTDGEKYRYVRYRYKNPISPSWLVMLFNKAAEENGKKYGTQFFYKDYSFHYDRHPLKNMPNGSMGFKVLEILPSDFANGGSVDEIAQIKSEINKLYSKAFKMFPNSPKQKEVIKQIDELRLKLETMGGKMAHGGSVDAKDTVTVDIPLMVRLLELSKEDIHSDAELHMVVERLLDLKNKPVLTMDDYEYIADVEHKYLQEKNMKKDHINHYENGGNLKYPNLSDNENSDLVITDSKEPSKSEIQEAIELLIELASDLKGKQKAETLEAIELLKELLV